MPRAGTPSARVDRTRGPLRELAFAGLLCAAVAAPQVDSSAFEFPAISHAWTLLLFAALLLVPFARPRPVWGPLPLDLVLLAALVLPLSLEHPPRQWPVMLVYPILALLFVRMLTIGRIGRGGPGPREPAAPRACLSVGWLLAGVAALALVHAGWALQGRVRIDVAEAGTRGAHELLRGEPLYGRPPGREDPHTDTYGPVDYETYVPFVAIASGRLAGRLTTLFFDLLTAVLLYVLGRRLRDRELGVVLAYSWLAFPLTLYEDALGLDDTIVACALVAAVLATAMPARRGAAAALAGWTKLSPLALVPLLAGGRCGGRAAERREQLRFAIGFAAATLAVFVPVLAHSGPGEFLARTFGFQAGRAPSESLWASLQVGYGAGAPWLATAAKVAHGLLVACAATFALVLLRVPRRLDEVGVAAAAAAVLIAVQACLGYYAYGYVLWFAPLALIAALARGTHGAVADEASGHVRTGSAAPRLRRPGGARRERALAAP